MANVAMADTPADPENTLYLDLKDGRVVIQLRPDLAPNHVKRIKELTRMGFYDGSKFHRVMEGFMAQTGDPTGTGRGGSGTNIKAEFSGEPFERGTVGMARAQENDSADSQFFICFAQASSLNGQYTVFGKVTSGMEFVDKIKRGDMSDNGAVAAPTDTVVKMQVAADADKPKAPEAAPAPAPDAAKTPAPAPEATPPAKP
ncbi:MAG: peptidylprolyl isomerase [Alphaproteobacteria bacterium]